MSLSQETKNAINVAVTAGNLPKRGRSNQLTLSMKRNPGKSSYVVLARADGSLTKAGEHYYGTNPSQPRPSSQFDYNTPLIKRGGNDYIRTKDGKDSLVRSLKADGKVVLTRIGRQYFKRKSTEYVVSVPVIVSGTNKRGQSVDRKTTLPTDLLGIGQILASDMLTEAQKIDRVKSYVLRELGLQTQNGRTVLMEISDETFSYDRDSEWQISSLTTSINEDGSATTQAAMRQPLAGKPLAAGAFLPFPDQILDCAWESHDDCLCVPRQLAVVLNEPIGDIIEYFNQFFLSESWQKEGVCPEDLKQFCMMRGLGFYFCQGHKLLDIYESKEKKRSIAFTAYNGHCYMYKSANLISKRSLAAEKDTENCILQNEKQSRLPPVDEWERYGTPKPGIFFTFDLSTTRRKLLESGRLAKITLKSGTELASLQYRCVNAKDGSSGMCHIRELPPEKADIENWLGNLPRSVEWRGEGIPALTQRCLLELLKAERRTPSKEEQTRILELQDGKCNTCGGIFDDDCEFDHIARLQQTVKGKKQLFQAICSSCHLEKTTTEGSQTKLLESRFSKRAWGAYVQSCRPPPLVWNAHSYSSDDAEQLLEIDVRRCRMNAMTNSAHEWSVFCVYDNVVKATPGTLSDFSYVCIKPGRRSKLSLLPYIGPMFYHRVAVEHLMHYAIATWDDILFSFSSTGRLPANSFKGPLQAMENAWDDKHLAKFSVNSMIGLWARDASQIYHAKTSNDAFDGKGSHMRRQIEYGDGEAIFDHIFSTKVLSNTSMRPIHDQIMHTEATRMAQAFFILSSLGVPQRSIKDVKTDAFVLEGVAKKRKAFVENISNVSFANLPNLRRKYQKVNHNQTFLDANGVNVKGCNSEDKVFRYSEDKVRKLQGSYAEPARNAELPTDRGQWQQLDQDAAQQRILDGGSLLVCGPPGCGKTFWVRVLINKLREKGKIVEIISKTHSAVQNIGLGAVTADHWIRRHIRNGSPKCNVLVVDEITQIDIQLWNDITKCLLKNISFVLCGDFYQFQAIAEHWCACPVPEGSLEKSDMLFDLAQGCYMQLTENKRSDQVLFDFYSGIRTMSLEDALMKGRQEFPVTEARPNYTLVISHDKRKRINRQLNLQERSRDAIFIRAPKITSQGNAPQNMWIWKGLRLLGAGGKCLKGVFYEIEECDNDVVKLKSGEELTHDECAKCLRLSYAITFSSCQGLTLPGIVRLEDTSNKHFTLRHLYVGISRCTSSKLLEIC